MYQSILAYAMPAMAKKLKTESLMMMGALRMCCLPFCRWSCKDASGAPPEENELLLYRL